MSVLLQVTGEENLGGDKQGKPGDSDKRISVTVMGKERDRGREGEGEGMTMLCARLRGTTRITRIW